MVLMKKQNRKKEKIVAKIVQTTISMRSCLQQVVVPLVVVLAIVQYRKLIIQRKNQIIRKVKRNLGGFLDLNNLTHFLKLSTTDKQKSPHFEEPMDEILIVSSVVRKGLRVMRITHSFLFLID
tara:strand:- start:61 stop:429 length:369 start_codon:yes stop_codon:yes gene_type:complete